MAYAHPLVIPALGYLRLDEEAEWFDFDTVKQWFGLIEDGVPEDIGLTRLGEEANSPEAPESYRRWYNATDTDNITAFTSLTAAESAVIQLYCTEEDQFYLRLNEDCRKRLWKKYVVYTSLLHSVCMKLRNMPMEESNQQNYLFRGLQCGTIKNPEKDFCWPCFTSATTDRSIAQHFGSTVLTLQSDTGAPVRLFSSFFEYEILFSPFFVFKAERKQTSVVYRNLSGKSNFFVSFPYYRGALLGSAVGNCLGAPFEFKDPPTMECLLAYFTEHEDPQKKGTLRYSCDASTTFALAKSLIEKNKPDIRSIKDSLTSEFMTDPVRNYGQSMVEILMELNEIPDCNDFFGPAQGLFGGTGSHGNGGVMRVTPAALFFYKLHRDNFKDKVSEITRLTHAHCHAINGAILQATAVKFALRLTLQGAWEKDIREEFIHYLLKTMKKVEQPPTVYGTKLRKIRRYLKQPATIESVRSDLGTGMSAVDSVPSAIYCFIRGLQPVDGIPAKYNGFERTIIYAISLGGDTDTIASMAGAIAGAYYGQDAVTQRFRDPCEAKAIFDAKRYAKQIHGLVWN